MSGPGKADESAAVVLRTALGDASLAEFPLDPAAAAKEAIDKMIRAGNINACAFVGAWLPIRAALNLKCITREGVIHLMLALLQQVVERRVVHPSVLVRLCDLFAIGIAGTVGNLADMALHMVRGSSTDLPYPEGALMRDQLAPGMLVFLLATLPYCARAVAAGAPGWQPRQLREVVDSMLRCSELVAHVAAKLKLGASSRWGQAHGEALTALQSTLDAPLAQMLGEGRETFLHVAAHVSVADLAAAAAAATPAATGEVAATSQVPIFAAEATAEGAGNAAHSAKAPASVDAAAAGVEHRSGLLPIATTGVGEAQAEMDADAAVAQVLEDLADGAADGGADATAPQYSATPAPDQRSAVTASGSVSAPVGPMLPALLPTEAHPLSVGAAVCSLTLPPLHDMVATLTAPLGCSGVAVSGEVCFPPTHVCGLLHEQRFGDVRRRGHCGTHGAGIIDCGGPAPAPPMSLSPLRACCACLA
jgi:hypothetical protein